MTTTKHRQTFYADHAIDQHLKSIPAQLRSNWINQALKVAADQQAPDLIDRVDKLEHALAVVINRLKALDRLEMS